MRSGTLPPPASDRQTAEPHPRGFGLYVHWPFCASKCPYCDFNSHVRDSIEEGRWRAALVASVEGAAAESGTGPLTSVFFGGGTPSRMSPETVAAVLATAARAFGFAPGVKITLEANPNSAEAENFRAFRAAGVNRLSLGIQALDDAALAFLGRIHSRAEALVALKAAQAVFDRTSFDLIYARPGQAPDSWRRELALALDLARGGHLSLYQLNLEPGTRFHEAHRRGDLVLPDDETSARLFEQTHDQCAEAGFDAYEISNFARPEEASRHNLTYWRYGGYAGVGPGAHGRLHHRGSVTATAEIRSPERWLSQIESAGHGRAEKSTLAARDIAEEMLLMGLRLSAGVRAADFEDVTGIALARALDPDTVATLRAGGMIAVDAEGLRATPAGALVLNRVIAELAETVRVSAALS